ncbi:hypothetical protein RHGRI_012150 [Rhododendron griersonianum]|uniref:DNA-directed RNA polymerase subunit n=1 Tax=Rhododendron griersonianum TaxID=479676 RepID=A0AAV6KPZ2_9ERIC|nr:hypothetical protein RHGRI_012150 [Rhododendron griersonianum]
MSDKEHDGIVDGFDDLEEAYCLCSVAVVGVLFSVASMADFALPDLSLVLLVRDLLLLKSTKEHGYFLAITKLKSIGIVEHEQESSDIFYPVAFFCRTFLPVKGDVMLGVVHKLYNRGGLQFVYLSATKMRNFHYVRQKTQEVFMNDDLTRIETSVVIRFLVFAAYTRSMFLKVQLPWNVIIPAESLDTKGLMLQKSIIIRLLDDFSTKKATKDLGYFLAVTTLDHIGEGKVRQHTGDVLFPVLFSCVTFKPLRGEILEGVVHKILKHGVFLRSGPIENIYLSNQKMSDYKNVPGENPIFMNDKLSKIEKDVVVRFSVIGTKYIEVEREFQAVVSLEGDFLGPVS